MQIRSRTYRRCYPLSVWALLLLTIVTAAGQSPRTTSQPVWTPDVHVNVRHFQRYVKDGDWSAAIQRAIDLVSKKNGFVDGATILFPAGVYRVDHTIVVGNNSAHWGLHLSGYGATLVGSTVLDKQKPVTTAPEVQRLEAPILLLKNPRGPDGGAYCIEGLHFSRQSNQKGVAISVPFSEAPRRTTFRNLKIRHQRVGIHINYAWEFSFIDCLFQYNHTGMIIQNQGNIVGIVNCAFRENHNHGLVIGPDRKPWRSNVYHISGSTFEGNKGYGLLLRSSGQTVITGNCFEANGNDIGVLTTGSNTTIDTNLFWNSYGHDWQINPYSDNAHIVLHSLKRVQIRNNRYAKVNAWFRRKKGAQPWEYVPRKGKAKPRQEQGYEYTERSSAILITGTLERPGCVFDTVPLVHQTARIRRTVIAGDDPLIYYQYDPQANQFSQEHMPLR